MPQISPAIRGAKLHVVHRRRFDADLRADVLSVLGYLFECPCGWRGKLRRTVAEARRVLAEHLESDHDGNPTKGGND